MTEEAHSSYRWVLSGIVEKPYRITLEQFIGTVLPPIPGARDPNHVHRHFKIERRAPFKGEFEIVFGRRRDGEEYSGLLHKGRRIGHSTFGSLYLEPAYRGKGLMSELIAERHLVTGKLLTLWAKEPPEGRFSPAGKAATLKAYNLLVERGAVVP